MLEFCRPSRAVVVFLLIFFSFLSISIILGQDAKFDHITIEQGISNSKVLCILQDSKGLLWFGTEDGLNKYDGYKITVYRHDPNDPNSINDDKIYSLFEDHTGTLWIGTQGGLNRFDRKKNKFTHWKHVKGKSNCLSNNTILSICGKPENNKTVLWLGTIDGLNRFDYNSGKFSKFTINPGKPETRLNNIIHSIAKYEPDILLIGTQTGLALFDTSKEKYIDRINKLKSIKTIVNDMVFSIYKDKNKENEVWLGTFRSGLINLNIENGQVTRFINVPSSPLSTIKNSISAILRDSKTGILWVGTMGGVYRYNKRNDIFAYFKNDPMNSYSLNNDIIRTIYQDQAGIIWFGSHNGLNKYDHKKNRFLHYRYKHGNLNSLSNNSVRSIFQDRSGNLWIGTKEGLNHIDRRNGKYTQFKNIPGNLSQNSITYIYGDPDVSNEILWIGTGVGLKKLNNKMKVFMSYSHDPKDLSSISDNFIRFIFRDSSKRLWVGTFNGLNHFDEKRGIFNHWKNDPKNPNNLSNNDITSIIEDENGILWIGTHNGLNRFDYINNKFVHYKNELGNTSSLSDNIVYTLIKQKKGQEETLWIGTDYGLSKMIREKGEKIYFKSYNKEDGLPNNKIYAILIDDQGYLWLSTNKGLSKFNPETELFRNYDKHDGLQSDQFSSAAFKNSNGEMFFGGNNGFNVFYPQNIIDNPHIPKVVITDFKKLYRSFHFDKSFSEVKEISLKYKDNIFSFEFASLDFSNSQKNQYAYRMIGFNDNWIYTGAKHNASFTNLDPGHYTFQVKGSNNDRVWNEKGISVKIYIAPPFYRTWWFRILFMAVLITSIISTYKIRTKRIKIRNIELQKEITERKQVEAELRKSEDALRDAYHELKGLKNRLEIENIYLQEEIKLEHNFGEIIGNSSNIKNVLSQIERVAETDSTILILGETGTGKELIARAVHNLSNRKDRPLVKVNCAALPATLIESELFGHEKGAFTGATAKRLGRFELADKGTLFLDEIGDLQMELQVKLLRILQEGEFERLGGTKTLKVDVRLIVATNHNLEELIQQGQFREDLFYRLNVFPLQLPPLRERKEDIPLLVNHFINKYSTKTRKKIKTVSQNIMRSLQYYRWPGNIRELENIIERAMVISTGNQLQLGNWFIKEKKVQSGQINSLEDIQKKHILMILEKTNWQIRGEYGAAELLGVKPTTLEAKMKKLSINRS